MFQNTQTCTKHDNMAMDRFHINYILQENGGTSIREVFFLSQFLSLCLFLVHLSIDADFRLWCFLLIT